MRLRKQKAIRSSSKSASLFSPAINICSNSGITEIAVLPKDLASVGTVRQPKIRTPSSFAIASIFLRNSGLLSALPIKNTPVAYLVIGGNEKSTTER